MNGQWLLGFRSCCVQLLAVSLLQRGRFCVAAFGFAYCSFFNVLLLAVSLRRRDRFCVAAFGFAYCSFWFGCVQSMTAWVIASAHVLVAVGRRMFITDRVIATLSIRTKTSISHL